MSRKYNLKKILDYYRRQGIGTHHQRSEYSKGFSRRMYRKRMAIIKAFLHGVLSDDAICLDVGCAEGWYTSWMSRTASFAVGMDLSLPKLRRAMKESNNAKTSYINASWDYSPFRDKTFGVALFSEGPEHSLCPEATMREISRVIKGGKYVVISSTTSPLEVEIDQFNNEGHGHLWRFTPDSLIGLVREVGFEVLRTDFHFPLESQRDFLISESYIKLMAFIRRLLKRLGVLNAVPEAFRRLAYQQTMTSGLILGIKRGARG